LANIPIVASKVALRVTADISLIGRKSDNDLKTTSHLRQPMPAFWGVGRIQLFAKQNICS
jgi:hypothetical protein